MSTSIPSSASRAPSCSEGRKKKKKGKEEGDPPSLSPNHGSIGKEGTNDYNHSYPRGSVAASLINRTGLSAFRKKEKKGGGEKKSQGIRLLPGVHDLPASFRLRKKKGKKKGG